MDTVWLVLTNPRRLFARLADGEVGMAWTFAALCCLLPRLIYGVLDGRGGPGLMLMRALVSAAVQSASATFFLGSAHFVFAWCVAPARANWRLSVRAAGYAQPITMVIGSLVASAMLVVPALRQSLPLRDAALFASASWYTLPLFWLGERLGLDTKRALFAALATSFGLMLALRALA